MPPGVIDKTCPSVADAVADVADGAVVMVGGFGEAGSPIELIHALIDQGARELTVVSNNCGSGEVGLAALLKAGRVRRVICSFPRTANSTVFPELYRSGRCELELTPQGTLAERIRAGGAGIPAFFTPTAVGTPLAEGKETREFGGRDARARARAPRRRRADPGPGRRYARQRGLQPDRPQLRPDHGDGRRHRDRAAARRVVPAGEIDPEVVVTPGIFVQRVVEVAEPAQESDLVAAGATYP